LALNQTSKQNNFQLLLKKKGRAPKLKKEKNILLCAAVRRAEPRGGLVPFKGLSLKGGLIKI